MTLANLDRMHENSEVEVQNTVNLTLDWTHCGHAVFLAATDTDPRDEHLP